MTPHMTVGGAILLALWAVLIAEMVGDKSLYALASLGLRFRWAIVFLAFTAANAIKLMFAVLVGSVILRSHSHWTHLISAVAFFVSAILIWEDEPPEQGLPQLKPAGWRRAALLCFSAFFFAEWGDPGQIAAAALVLKSNMPLAIWLGAMLALSIKGAAALTVGQQIRNRLPLKTLRIVASGSCCVLGILAIGQSFKA